MISEASFSFQSNGYRLVCACISKQKLQSCQWAVAQDILKKSDWLKYLIGTIVSNLKHLPGNILARIQNNFKSQVFMSIEIEFELPLLNKSHSFRKETALYLYILVVIAFYLINLACNNRQLSQVQFSLSNTEHHSQL